jgi:hypothetical protein
MLYLNVAPIFVARAIDRPSTFLIKAGFSAHSAHYILHSKPDQSGWIISRNYVNF